MGAGQISDDPGEMSARKIVWKSARNSAPTWLDLGALGCPAAAGLPWVYGRPYINPEPERSGDSLLHGSPAGVSEAKQRVASVPHVSLVKGNSVFFQKRTKLILKRNLGMVFRLVCDVAAHGLHIRCAHGKSPVSCLPGKFCNLRKTLLNPKVGTSLEFFHQIGLGNAATQLDQNVGMIGNTTDQNGRAIEFFGDSSEKGVNLPANIFVGQKRKALFGGEDDVQKDAGQRLGHGGTGYNPDGVERG